MRKADAKQQSVSCIHVILASLQAASKPSVSTTDNSLHYRSPLSSNHLPLAFEPLTVSFSWFCVSNPKRQVTWEFIQVQYFLKGCGLSEVLSRSYTCENTVILFIRSDTLTTICEVLLQQSIEHVCLHTSINSPVKCSYLQSDKATTPNSILCLSYNLTIFVKSKAKKQTVKMQGVDIACILVLGSHFKTIYSSRARIIRVEIQCAI